MRRAHHDRARKTFARQLQLSQNTDRRRQDLHLLFCLDAAANGLGDISRLPYSLKVLLENLLRNEDGRSVTKDDIIATAKWTETKGKASTEIGFRPARVLMQDFTGVPAVVDLAAMRDGMNSLGGDPRKINPLVPVDLVIDHSVIVDAFGNENAFARNVELEYERNGERYNFLKWGQSAFDNFRVVPPGTGICHQVNLEYLSQVVWTREVGGETIAYPDTLVGTDSHTTMVNGLSVLGWGVGGIEAEAAMLGQAQSMLVPEVIGFRLTGRLKEGVTATDLVLTVTQMLRKKGVVAKFVEFFGPGLDSMTLADRATISNMAPEYGATCGFFPVDAETINYLNMSGRADDRIALVEEPTPRRRVCSAPARPPSRNSPIPSNWISAMSCRRLAGPKRPEGRISLENIKPGFATSWKTNTSARRRNWQTLSRRQPRFRLGPRRRRDCRHHQLHQHLEPECADRGRTVARNAALKGLTRSRGSRLHWRRARRSSPPISRRPACKPTSTRSDSISSASAARPASVTPDRCRPTSLRPSTRTASLRAAVLVRQPQLRGSRQSGRAGQLSCLATAWSSPMRWPEPSTRI